MDDLLSSVDVPTAVVVAFLAFILGLLAARHTNAMQRNEEIRRRRVETYAAFCSAAVAYRSAQLTRWHERVRSDQSPDGQLILREAAQELRVSRATAWSEYYKVVMICNDEGVEKSARETLRLARSMKLAGTPEEIDQRSDQVHAAIDDFARIAGRTVTVKGKLRELAPSRRVLTTRSDRDG